MLRDLLPDTLPAETFQQAMRALNEKVLVVVENSGVIDVGLFLAMIGLLCTGDPFLRKSIAFEALQWRRGPPVHGAPVLRRDAEGFLKLVRQVYLPSQPELTDSILDDSSEDVHLDEFSMLLDEVRKPGYGG